MRDLVEEHNTSPSPEDTAEEFFEVAAACTCEYPHVPPYPFHTPSSSPPPPLSDLIIESNGPSVLTSLEEVACLLPVLPLSPLRMVPPSEPPRVVPPSSHPPTFSSLSGARNGQMPPPTSCILLESNVPSVAPPPSAEACAPQHAPPIVHPLS